MKSYVGRRLGHNWQVSVVENGLERPLPLRTDLYNHSPTGFSWGYAGSGPHQLALALIADATGDDERTLKTYGLFATGVIAKLDIDKNWGPVEASEIVATVEEIEKYMKEETVG